MKKYIFLILAALLLSRACNKKILGTEKRRSKARINDIPSECPSDEYHVCKKGYYSPLYCTYSWWISHG